MSSYDPVQTGYYRLFNAGQSYADAKQACFEAGGRLPILDEEQEFKEVSYLRCEEVAQL